MSDLASDLAAVVGPEHVLTDPDVTASYGTDWSRRYAGPVAAAVRPGSTAEVAGVLRVAGAHGVPVIPQGGNSGLVGGSVPGPRSAPTIVLSTRRLTRLDPVDDLAGQVTAGAGVTIADLRRHVLAAGWDYGVDLAAREVATVGGTIGTNAGGIRVCCYGMTRRQVVGIEAVLADGSVVEHLGGLPKDNTGYDLVGLMVGSEGTLGVVTAARLALVRPVRASAVALVGVDSAADAMDLVRTAVPEGTRLLAAEIVDAETLRLVCEVNGLSAPLPVETPHVLTIETESAAPGEIALDLPEDRIAVVGMSSADRERLWAYRDKVGETVTAVTVPHRFDVSVPLASWDAFADTCRARLADVPDVERFLVFGHIADGNLHLEVIGPAPEDERAAEVVLTTVAEHAGSVSAEHGVGRQKAAYLHLTRSPAEIATMRALKAALDPEGLLNPGVLLP
jgi:FAD/FMN-containing dehydrogenase